MRVTGTLVGGAVAVVLATACAPAMVWQRPGGTGAELERDQTECASLADESRMVPHFRQIGRTGRADVVELEEERYFSLARYEACLRSRGYRQVPAPARP